jgi:hypothetical protein
VRSRMPASHSQMLLRRAEPGDAGAPSSARLLRALAVADRQVHSVMECTAFRNTHLALQAVSSIMAVHAALKLLLFVLPDPARAVPA